MMTNDRKMAHVDSLVERYPQLEACREDIVNAYDLLEEAYAAGRKLLVAGNGGSASDSEHIVGELMKGFYLQRPLSKERKAAVQSACAQVFPGMEDRLQQGLPAIALTGHAALSTAVQNDVDPLLAPAEQVLGYARKGDVLIGISTSGNARNVAAAVCVAKALGLTTLGLTGGDGGRLKALCDAAIVAPARTPADVQEYHLPLYHTLCAMLEARFFEA